MGIEIEYSQEKELDEALDNLLHSDAYFLPVLNSVKVAACFCVRTNDAEATVPGKGEPVVLKKVEPDMQVFMKPKIMYILVVDYHFWENADDRQKKGHMHRALSRIKVEKTEKGLKVTLGKWDIQENLVTLKAIGVYTEPHVMFVEMVRNKQLSMVQSVVNRMTVAPDSESDPKPDPEPETDPEEKPHIVAGPPPDPPAPKTPKKNKKNDEDEPRRPARRIPPEPVKTVEPEPESDPEPEDQ
jgi:hypothetical protein